MESVWLFCKALAKRWLALMSCAVFTFIGLYALITGKSNRWLVYASLAAGVLLFLVAAFLTWNEEHSELESEKAKRFRPDVTAEFGWVNTPHKWYLRLYNSSESPAVDVHIDDIRKGDSVIRFGPISSLRNDRPAVPTFGILRDGFTPTDDLGILFMDGEGLQTFDLRVRFSSLDSRRDRRSWILSAVFWYDRQQNQIVIQNQSIE